MNYLCFKQDKCILMSTAAILEFYELKRKEKNTLKNMVKVLRNKKKSVLLFVQKGVRSPVSVSISISLLLIIIIIFCMFLTMHVFV